MLRCLGVAVALAVLFAGVGFVEYYRKSLFLNPKVVAANQYSNYFRVNSVFFDPSIYGRFLALVMIAVMTVVLAPRAASDPARRRRTSIAAAAVLAWLAGGLVTSFSQSSIAALLLGLAVLGAWCWGVRPALYLSGGLVALAARRPAARAGRPALRAEGLERLGGQRHERAHHARLRGPRTVRANARSRATARALSKPSTSATARRTPRARPPPRTRSP